MIVGKFSSTTAWWTKTVSSEVIMASELSANLTVTVNKATMAPQTITRTGTFTQTVTGVAYAEGSLSAVTATNGTSVPLSDVTAPHWGWFSNLDSTNYIKIINRANSNAVIARVLAGESAWIPLDPACTPAVQGFGGAVQTEFLILPT